MGASCSRDSCGNDGCQPKQCDDPPCGCETTAQNDTKVAAILAAAALVAALILGGITDQVDWDSWDQTEQYTGGWIGFAICTIVLLGFASSYGNAAYHKAPDGHKKKQCLAATWAPWAALLVWALTRIFFKKATWDGRVYDASSAAVYGVLFGTMVLLSVTSAQL